MSIEVKFDPSPSDRGSGLTAQLSWAHPNMIAALSMAIDLREGERIKTVEISRDGITVRLEQTS